MRAQILKITIKSTIFQNEEEPKPPVETFTDVRADFNCFLLDQKNYIKLN